LGGVRIQVIGILSWYDESPSWLSTCVAGIGRVCDTIIAIDGAYQLYPAARARSHPDQSEAIIQAAEAAGCGLILHRPKEVWAGNEVGKRNHTLDLARSIGVDFEDWLMIVDGDFHVLQAYPEIIREQLAATARNVATYTVLDGKDLMTDEFLAEQAQKIDISTEWTVRIRGIFRLLPNLRYQTKHWHVTGTSVDGRGVTLFGPPDREEPPLLLENALVFYHRRQARALVRLQAAENYYAIRDRLGAEGDPVAT
jgi:hypothetical protein